MTMSTTPYPAWIYRQSAVVPYRWKDGKLDVLIISSSGGKRWVVPKGIVEPGLSPAASAAAEAAEEAGVEGDVGVTPLGRYRYRKWGGTCEVEVYPMLVHHELPEWPESSFRRRRWLPVDEAANEAGHKELGQLIAGLPQLVDPPPQRVAHRQATMATEATEAPRLVYLFRHAKSSWSDPDLADFDRPLAPRGERACQTMARYFRRADIHPGLVYCSPALRTRQTLEGVRPGLGEDLEVRYDHGLYHAGPQTMLSRLRRTPDDVRKVMLIAHNPGLQILAQHLIGSGAEEDLHRLSDNLPTGALAILVNQGHSWKDLAEGSCELHSLVGPRDLDVDP
ncbi:MAG: histidine phosphatase family protein [Acidimicrobiia bacterium]|nr:histidine phosphatase family protein [Acidimicrobiia bacterium]